MIPTQPAKYTAPRTPNATINARTLGPIGPAGIPITVEPDEPTLRELPTPRSAPRSSCVHEPPFDIVSIAAGSFTAYLASFAASTMLLFTERLLVSIPAPANHASKTASSTRFPLAS
ncbi:MAG TPA: hypothetical protein VHC70_06665, partial [Phycisphaerales bacterium]|nr:hypothetical protein [Phycisphaerales bacterium]